LTGLLVLTLTLGIGATTAIFSVVDAVVFNPLPFPKAERIVEVWTQYAEAATRQPGAAGAVVAALKDETRLFEQVEAYQFGVGTLTGVGEPEMVSFPGVSTGIFTIFPTTPQVGRLFSPGDSTMGESVVLISDRLWTGRFGRDPAVLDRHLTIDGHRYRIVGVLQPRFSFPESSTDLWRPIDTSSAIKQRLQVVALRREGVTFEQVNERLTAVTAGLQSVGSLPAGQSLVSEVPIQVRYSRTGASAFYLLLGAVSVLLLVACVNVSNLLLVRASTRHGELALMTALGAGRAVLLRQAFCESLYLALAGGAAGLLLANGLLELILGLAPPRMTYLSNATGALDTRAVWFALGLVIVTCLVFGVLPAWRVSRVDASHALKHQARTLIGSRDAWWQGALVAGQLALVVVLLAGAGLLLRSYIKLNQVDLGFDPEGIAVVEIQMPSRYGTGGAGRAFMREVESRVERRFNVPASLVSATPVRSGGLFVDVTPEAEGQTLSSSPVSLPYSRVSADFFDVVGIPLVAGRTFAPGDGEDTFIVNEVLARRYWGTQSPIGRRFRTSSRQPWSTVVGVARDIKTMGPTDERGEGMEIYYPMLPGGHSTSLALMVRAGADAAGMLPELKQIVWGMDPNLPILAATTMTDVVGDSIGRQRFVLLLASAFSVCAVVLGSVGVYGVSAYWVASRRRELAIRLAIGASPASVMRDVLVRGLRLAAIGGVAGLALALAGARVMESALFSTSARDPLTLFGVTALLALLAVVACAVPAFRASRVDPMSVLRAD